MKIANYIALLIALISVFMVTEFAWKTELIFELKPECVDGSAKLISYYGINDCFKSYHLDLTILITAVVSTAMCLIMLIIGDENRAYLDKQRRQIEFDLIFEKEYGKYKGGKQNEQKR